MLNQPHRVDWKLCTVRGARMDSGHDVLQVSTEAETADTKAVRAEFKAFDWTRKK